MIYLTSVTSLLLFYRKAFFPSSSSAAWSIILFLPGGMPRPLAFLKNEHSEGKGLHCAHTPSPLTVSAHVSFFHSVWAPHRNKFRFGIAEVFQSGRNYLREKRFKGLGCSSVDRVLTWHARSPGFNLQHHINQMCWYMPLISALWLRNSRGSEVQGYPQTDMELSPGGTRWDLVTKQMEIA